MEIQHNWLIFLDLPISGSMSKKEHTDMVTSQLLIFHMMMTILPRVCLCLPCYLIISLLTQQSVSAKLISDKKYKSINKHVFLADIQKQYIDVQAAKRHIIYYERLQIRTGLRVHRGMFQVSRIEVKNTIASAKSEYYNKNTKISKRNQRTVFSVVNKVLSKCQTIINSDKYMVHCFSNFTCQMIVNIHDGHPFSTISQGVPLVEVSCMYI